MFVLLLVISVSHSVCHSFSCFACNYRFAFLQTRSSIHCCSL